MATITAAEFKAKHTKEKNVYRQISQWLRAEHPNILYRWDVGADVRLTIGQATKLKALQMPQRGFPDLIIFKPAGRINRPEHPSGFIGMALEVKKDGTKLQKRDGKTWATPHIEEQSEMLIRFEREGYFAAFVCGFENTKTLIQEYLSGKL